MVASASHGHQGAALLRWDWRQTKEATANHKEDVRNFYLGESSTFGVCQILCAASLLDRHPDLIFLE